MPSSRPLLAAATVIALALTGCAATSAPAGTSAANDATLNVGASFYPLQYVAERVGGEQVEVSPLISAGVEPHDAELSPAVVRSMQSMDTVLYLSEFSAAVDQAIATTGVRALDAHPIVEDHAAAVAAHGETEHDHEDGHASDDVAQTDDDEHDHADGDPHFWLDPSLMAELAEDVVAEMSELDPAHAADYEARGTALTDELSVLDDSFAQGLATCERRDVFVSHEAYGYLATRYDLHQQGLSGLDPEAEPSPARVREIRDLVQETGATTLFTESLVSADVADSLAQDVGVATAVLDPLESIADGDDYRGVMTRNLEALRSGLDCS